MSLFMSVSRSGSCSGRGSVTVYSRKTMDSVEQSKPAPSIHLLPKPNLKVKRVDHFYSRWSNKWKYRDSSSSIIPEIRLLPSDGKDDPWKEYCFVVIRRIPQEDIEEPRFSIVVKSPYLLKACKDVIGKVASVSWNAVPLELYPHLFLAFLPDFEAYQADLKATPDISEEDSFLISTVDVLIDYLRTDFCETVAKIENLTSHGEITFDLLYAVMVPRSIMVTTCPVTGEIRALQLVSAAKVATTTGCFFKLILEGVDVNGADGDNADFGRTQSQITILPFDGTVKLTLLDAYPIQYHPREAELRASLLSRGRKWASLTGIHHMHYNGTGAFKLQGRITKYNLNSRIMIDRVSFQRINPNYALPGFTADAKKAERRRQRAPRCSRRNTKSTPVEIPLQVQNKRVNVDLTNDELLLASPVLWGFSLSDKMWLEFNVEKVSPIEWQEEAFSNLVIPSDKKALLQSLVEAHDSELGFDDFIRGKGKGLVVNLCGPTGVGKTFSAEATSEHVRRPLYVVGAGTLGTKASELDQRLQRIFELATVWKAIVLIDEADVFLEQRSSHDLERNAMVAVFLRHLEYYPAILFLTTNMVERYDDAFLSRTHVALQFHALSTSARAQVWTAFLAKVGVQVGKDGGMSHEELSKLSEREINGRQVKNAAKTASSLAVSRGETLRYEHLVEVLDIMEQFFTEVEGMKGTED